MTSEYPELFYRVEPIEDGQEALIFDGKTNTHEDLIGDTLDKNNLSYCEIVFKMLTCGLYQKTLLLIKETGIDGLKLGAWAQSIVHNFQGFRKDEDELKLMEISPLLLFRLLASYKLIILKSDKNYANDLRLHFPDGTIYFEKFVPVIVRKIKLLRECQNDQENLPPNF